MSTIVVDKLLSASSWFSVDSFSSKTEYADARGSNTKPLILTPKFLKHVSTHFKTKSSWIYDL